MRFGAALFFILIGASPAAAQLAGCKGTTQSELTGCANDEYKKADAALNQTYDRLRGKLANAADRDALAAAERAWIAYRDRECAFETSGTAGGSIQPMLLALCLNEKTLVHNAELGRQLNCQEGDPSCAH